jgi:endonuclease/exonuclease/phosphatase (EEP) superfamily protein YafD
MRYIAGQPAQQVFSPQCQFPFVHKLPEGALLPDYKRLKVLVWNIFKQQRAEWQSVITDFGKDSHLVMLQEAQTTPELVTFATCNFIGVDQVPALSLPQHPSGVMTLATTPPIFCCPLREREPLLRLAKSALITVYPMPNGQMLMAVNMHAVNFCLGIDIYRKQLATVGEHMLHHVGPVLMAGDFNAWSQPRIKVLYQFIRQQKMKEVAFADDFRRTAFGRPLDFIFYRGVGLEQAAVLKTDASDHNPLLAEFSFS